MSDRYERYLKLRSANYDSIKKVLIGDAVSTARHGAWNVTNVGEENLQIMRQYIKRNSNALGPKAT